MKRLFLTLSLLVIGCSDNSLGPQEDCYCGLEISSNLPQSNGIYELEYDSFSINPASMTDENGGGQVVFAVWEEFIEKTITVYGGYTDECGHHFLDSIKVKVVDNE